jgi:predicted O-methyltransferase YrrM
MSGESTWSSTVACVSSGMQTLWSDVDRYFGDLLVPRDAALESALAASDAAGLPSIQVSRLQGKMLQLLAEITGARTILEIGTLGGYSAIWLARALPDGGRLVTLESDPKHADVARENLARAGLARAVEVRVGRALETLLDVARDPSCPFDMVFIDADKQSLKEYFEWALRLTRPGGVIVVDNVVRGGAVLDGESADARVQGVRRFAEALAREPRVSATATQTVGSKGHDGFVLARVLHGAGSNLRRGRVSPSPTDR